MALLRRPTAISSSSFDSVDSNSSYTAGGYSAGSEWDSFSEASDVDADSLPSPAVVARRNRQTADDTCSSCSTMTSTSTLSGIQALQQSIKEAQEEEDLAERMMSDLESAITKLRVLHRRTVSASSLHSSTESHSPATVRPLCKRASNQSIRTRIPAALVECELELHAVESADLEKVFPQQAGNVATHPASNKGGVSEEDFDDMTSQGQHFVSLPMEGDGACGNQSIKQSRKQSAPAALGVPGMYGMGNACSNLEEEDEDAMAMDAITTRRSRQVHIDLWLSGQEHTWC